MKLYQKIARVASQKNTPKKAKELALLQKLMPIDNGIESFFCKECVISLESTEKRIVIDTAYWHPNVSYDTIGFLVDIRRRWTDHQIVITPSFEGEINIQVSGKLIMKSKSAYQLRTKGAYLVSGCRMPSKVASLR